MPRSPDPFGYDTVDDPYCYRGTSVLKNRAGIRDHEALEAFEHEASLQRAEEPFPPGRLSVSHYCAIHHHLFQDVYTWAGRFRSVRISKGGSMFCYPEHIPAQMHGLFGRLRSQGLLRGLSREAFVREAAAFLTQLNAIHPFRDGNGRTQLAFLDILAGQAGHPLALESLDPEAMLRAMVASFVGDEEPLRRVLRRLVEDS